ncbi:MAG: glycosyltransferase family 2 protein [Lachnospiraceae bacterium]|nr:glycosyltransferase family 2 protein [Lachnospiraceae bacterium]
MKLTVFTPTYDRAHLLGRVYESLKDQTCRDFCWLIVDDGSTDDTKDKVEGFIKEGIIPIEYHYVENGGKMRAHNRGVEHCTTDWFVCLDSDDILTAQAVGVILKTIEDNKLDDTGDPDKARIAGIIAHKGKSESQLLNGVDFPEGISRTTLYNLYLKGFKGETTLVFRTSVLKEYPFPEIEGEKYVPEDYIYDKIDSGHEYLVIPKILTVCELVSEGYTDSVRRLKEDNLQAWYLYYEQRARITPMSVLKLKYLSFYRLYAGMSRHKLNEATGIPAWQKLLGIPGEIVLKLTGKI